MKFAALFSALIISVITGCTRQNQPKPTAETDKAAVEKMIQEVGTLEKESVAPVVHSEDLGIQTSPRP